MITRIGIGLVTTTMLLSLYLIGVRTQQALREIPAPPVRVGVVPKSFTDQQGNTWDLAGATVLFRDQHGNVTFVLPNGRRFFVNNQGSYFRLED